jgi:hypothetical protein
MSCSIRLLTGALAGAVLIGHTSLVAQDVPRRQGFFIGFGLGAGDGSVNNERVAAMTGWLTLGGTVSPKIRLAADFEGLAPINAVAITPDDGDMTTGTTTFSVLFYPSATSSFFLKGGVGAASVAIVSSGPDGTGVGFGGTFGLGYDVRIGRNISLTPQLTWFGGRTGDIEDEDGNRVANDVTFGAGTLSIGIVFH